MESSKPKILIVDDEDILRRLLVRFMANEGFEPIEAPDGPEAIELFRLKHPDVVLSDVMMPEMDGINLLKELRCIDPSAVVILMTGFGNEQVLLNSLRAGANNFFKKPFNFKEMLETVNNVLKYKLHIDPTPFYSPFLQEEKKEFLIETGKANLLPIINQITVHLKNVFPENDIMNLKIGIEEMLNNALEHGNLNISSQEKHRAIEDGCYGQLLQNRMSEQFNSRKKIVLNSQLSKDKLKVVIKDEGRGFNWKSLPEPFMENLLRFNGRGIFLTKIFFDEVVYNEKGNEVTIIKYKDKDKNFNQVCS
ncbi:MAG: response regulator [Spirochaetales bacterium]|nr:response regulator [Spirochaetales bacterium]